jgi:uncharacterized membrane protein YuzA (DUF378 family)
MKIASVISMILVIVGAIVWLLVGLFNFNVVSMLFGDASTLSRVIYSLVGLGGLFTIFFIFAYRPFQAVP